MNKTAVALGTFDGLHKGHIEVLKKALSFGEEAIAVTFKAPPKSYFEKEIKNIILPEEKEEALKEMGFSRVVFLDFESIKDTDPQEFLEMLKNNYNCGFISCGFNYRFGKNGAGDTGFLRSFCRKNGIELSVSDAVKDGGEVISSTLIRSLLLNGEVEKVNKICLKPFSFKGEIVHGDARGRTIGFPTVNQIYPIGKANLKFGVYKSEITVDGETHKAITNIGKRPTYEVDYTLAETYIVNFNKDVYGKTADLRLLKFIRPEKKFSGIDELKKQIEEDIKE